MAILDHMGLKMIYCTVFCARLEGCLVFCSVIMLHLLVLLVFLEIK